MKKTMKIQMVYTEGQNIHNNENATEDISVNNYYWAFSMRSRLDKGPGPFFRGFQA